MTIGLGPNAGGVLRLVKPGVYLHWCVGCNTGHTFNISSTDHPDGKRWEFDGNLSRPSVEPELQFDGCSYRIRDGFICYGESAHPLSRKVVPLPEFPR